MLSSTDDMYFFKHKIHIVPGLKSAPFLIRTMIKNIADEGIFAIQVRVAALQQTEDCLYFFIENRHYRHPPTQLHSNLAADRMSSRNSLSFIWDHISKNRKVSNRKHMSEYNLAVFLELMLTL
jgi:hypothetical protein